MAKRLYFAYGSNINLEQMAVRCPAALMVGPAVLDGYELLFRGNRRGAGVAPPSNLCPTARSTACCGC